MKNVWVIAALLLVTGIAAGAWLLRASAPVPVSSAHFDSTAATEDRLAALERAIAEERDARQLLEEELLVLYAEIERLSEPVGLEANESVAVGGTSEIIEQRSGRFRDDPEGRRDRLIEAGFSPDRAEWIARRESELQMESMQALFEARRSGEPIRRSDPSLNPSAMLRAEIGDAEYEQFLTANGQSTSVRVGAVLESSPGQTAGLQPGDEIIRYDGQRVFNTFELNQQTMQGEPGQSVVMDVMRDGTLVQVVVPRGPIGVTTGRGFRSRRGG